MSNVELSKSDLQLRLVQCLTPHSCYNACLAVILPPLYGMHSAGVAIVTSSLIQAWTMFVSPLMFP